MKRKAGSYARTARRVGKRVAGALTAATTLGQYFKQAKKRPKARSATRTKTKRKYGHGVVQSTGHGISKSYSVTKYKPMKGLNHVRQNTNLDIFRSVNTNTFLAPTGRQVVGVHVTIGPSRLKQLIIESVSTQVAAYATFGQANRDISRDFWFMNYKSKCTYTNQGPNTIQMEIYDLMYKTDVAYDNILPGGNSTPNEVWERGLKQEAGIDSAQEFRQWSSSGPEDCKLFRQRFKILKKTQVEMHTGANHEHNFTFSYNGKVPMNKIEEMQSFNNQALKGISYVRMVVIRGMPTDDDATWSEGTVTRARAKVISIDEQIYTTRLATAKGRHIAYNNVLEDEMENTYNQNPDGQGIADTVTNVVDALKAFS